MLQSIDEAWVRDSRPEDVVTFIGSILQDRDRARESRSPTHIEFAAGLAAFANAVRKHVPPEQSLVRRCMLTALADGADAMAGKFREQDAEKATLPEPPPPRAPARGPMVQAPVRDWDAVVIQAPRTACELKGHDWVTAEGRTRCSRCPSEVHSPSCRFVHDRQALCSCID